jgi:hypothetical protein
MACLQILSTVFEANYRILGLAAAPKPFGSKELTKALARDAKENKHLGTSSRAWWEICVTLGDETCDVRWLAEMMPQFDEAFDAAFVKEGEIMNGFMTTSKSYSAAFSVYMKHVEEMILKRIMDEKLDAGYKEIPGRLEWLLRHGSHSGGLPIPVITNRFLGWMANVLKGVTNSIEEVSTDSKNLIGSSRRRPRDIFISDWFVFETTRLTYEILMLTYALQISTWFDPIAIYMLSYSHNKLKARDLSATIMDAIQVDPAMEDLERACDAVSFTEFYSY